jgi:hypothetical protein
VVIDALEEHTPSIFSAEFLPDAIVRKFYIEDEGISFFRHVGTHLPGYMMCKLYLGDGGNM